MIESPSTESRRPAGVPRRAQMLGGVLITLVAAAVVGINWRMLLADHMYNPRAAVAAPAFVVIGLALTVIPGYREERLARGEDLSQLHGMALITPRWWAVVALALAAGLANWFLMNQQ